MVQNAYRIDYSDDAGLTWKLLERTTRFTGFSPTKPYVDDKGLAFDENRHYRVFAIGGHPYTDVGPPSEYRSPIANGWTLMSGAPKKPTGVMASAPDLTSIMASWTAPETTAASPSSSTTTSTSRTILTGLPRLWTSLAARRPSTATTEDAMTMATFDKLTLLGDTKYVFRVAAVNKVAGTGADRPAAAADVGDNWSAPVLFDTSEAAKPNAVEGLTSELATDASGDNRGVNLLWNKPSDDIAISNYEVEVQTANGDWVNPTLGENVPAHRTAYTDSNRPKADEMRVYRVRAVNMVGDGPWTKVYYPREEGMHTHVAASGTIRDRTVTVDTMTTVDAAMYFSDNTGATYAAESDMPMYATVMTDANSGVVTIIGVAEGMAMITVTATSGAVEATQEFMVTVTPAALGAPMNVMAEIRTDDRPEGTVYNVKVTWTDGDNSDAHWVGLYDAVNNRTHGSHRVAGDPSVMEHTFSNVPPGVYLPAVISTLEGFTPMVDYARLDDGRPRLTVISAQ